MIKSLRELEVWKRAHALVLEVYRITNLFPRSEQFGVVSQLRWAAYSVQKSTKELLQCLAISNGWVEEVRYFRLLSRDLRYLPSGELEKMERELKAIAEMIEGLATSLQRRLTFSTSSPASSSSRNTGHGTRATKQSLGVTH